MRLQVVSTFILLFATAVNGFTLQQSVVVTATRQLQQRLPTLTSALTSSNEEAATTTSTITSSDNDDGAVATTTATNSEDTTTTTTSKTPLIVVNGHNIELTSSLVDYINKRIGNILSKLASHGAVRECDVVLSVNKNPKVNYIIKYFS